MQTLLLLTLLSPLLSPQWDTDPDLWGVGIMILTSPVEREAPEQANLLPNGLGLACYAKPEGELLGFLFQQGRTEHLAYFYPQDGQGQEVNPHDFRETGYETRHLIVFERRDSWVRVLRHSQDRPVWLYLPDLLQVGYAFQPWMDFMLQSDNTFHPHEEYGMNLRGGPGTDQEKLASIKGDRYNITLTGKTDENWAEVKVIENTVHPCEDGVPTGREWIGWLKLIDDRGFPNLWFYTRGC